MKRNLFLISCLLIPILLASCSQSTKPSSLLILNESVIYPTDEPPFIQIKTDNEAKMISTVDDYPSPPKISLDKTKLVYIAPFDFETLGEVWLYGNDSDAPKKVFDRTQFGEDQSVKQVHWLDDSHLIILTGNRYGTVSINQSLYVWDTASKEAKSVLQEKGNRDIRDLTVNDSGVEILIVTYNDDFTEETFETKSLKITDLY
ncbi:DUF4652 domain-containing protein [Paenibacillus harenae]|uniref:WD40 repeat domain-containing protein n=1 Tax=Paenibacillus harenae TaxID=306543 RepID=A0ABT9U9H2_PAEHA|nr:DUF4652 domain-containing protein [Paenibacillus harenae]MDQ0116295.1 hypothetical protein [Paenibacillus harenae]